jgi:predicted transcriptional regulator
MKAVEHELGPLQQAAMDYTWEHPGCTVRECRDALAVVQGKEHAYTTIQTVFDVLHRKRLVARRRSKNAFQYTARQSRGDLLGGRLRGWLGQLGLTAQPAASSLVDALEGGNGDELRALIEELKARGYVE